MLGHTSVTTSTVSGTKKYYEIVPVPGGTTSGTTRTTSGTRRYYEALRQVLENTKNRATRYDDIMWHYKSDEVIQDAIIG